MADDGDNPASEPPGERAPAPGAPGGRPGKRKVTPAGATTPTTSGRVTPSPKARPRKGPRKVWQRGIFWFGAIVVVTLLCLGATYAIDRRPDEVDLGGADVTAFCAKVRVVSELESVNPSLSVDDAPRVFDQQRAELQELAAVAPPDVQADVARLSVAATQMRDKANEILAKKTSDPFYGTQALIDLLGESDRLGRTYDLSTARVANAARQGCGIDVTATTTPVGTTPGTPRATLPGLGTTVAPAPGPPATGATGR